jgi:hypothetical protein
MRAVLVVTAVAAAGLMLSCARQSRSADAGPPSARQPAWHCEVTFHREHGEDSWERGLFFRLTAGHKVIAGSYMCTGGG